MAIRRHSKFVPVLITILVACGWAFGQDIRNVARENTLIFENIEGRVPIPGNMNPYISGQYLDWGMWQATQEALFYYNYETGELEPWLALKGEYAEDFESVTVELREGVKWGDGTAFTADDVVFTINMLKANPELQYAADMDRWVREVKAVGPLEVQFTLTEPNPRFLLDFFGVRIWETLLIAPKHIWENVDPVTFNNFDLERGLPLGTGPYRLVRSTETETVFDRQDTWWAETVGFKQMPAPERVIWVAAGTEDVRAAMAVNNQLDAMWIFSRGSFETARARNPNIVGWTNELPYAYLDPCTRYLGLNNGVAPFDNRMVRWAVNDALNREELVVVAYEGMTEAAVSLYPTYPPLQEFLDRNAQMLDQFDVLGGSPARVDERMSEAGFVKNNAGMWVDESGQRIAFEIITRSGEADKLKMGPVIVDQLRRAGFDASFRALESVVYYTDVANGSAQAYITDMCGSVADPYKTLSLFHSRWSTPIGVAAATPYVSRFEDAAYDQLVDKLAVTPADSPEFADLADQALEIWVENLPAIPLVQARLLTPFNTTYWSGWPTADNNYIQPGHWWVTGNQLIHNVTPSNP